MKFEELQKLAAKKPRNRKEAIELFNNIKNYANGPEANPIESLLLAPLLDDLEKLVNRKVRGFEPLNPFVTLPQRATKKSAGYDFRANDAVIIPPGEMVLVKTGVTAYMESDEYLDLRIRSGLAYKHNLTLQNDAGVVDSDYYGNDIGFLIRNEGSQAFIVNPGDRIGQGIFTKYLTTDDDLPQDQERESGFGHTGLK